MPPSSKRSQRTKREVPSYDATDDTMNSSPSRPAKRRRTKEVVEEPAEEAVPERTKLPKTQDELDMETEALVAAVSQHLALPEGPVQAAIDHDNEKHHQQSKDVQAYAKITGRNWTFYVKRITTNIGRPPEGFVPPAASPVTPAASNEGADLPAANTEESRIHIDLGPNKLVSRLHANIFFDDQNSGWGIIVNGRNGAKIDDVLLRRGQSAKLNSGRVIEIAGVEMMFILPEDGGNKLEINERYLRRAKLIDPDSRDDMPPDQKGSGPFDGPASQGPRGPNPHGPLPIAPAPPDYRRPNTPPAKQRGSKGGAFTHSPYAAADGTMMMDHLDLSLDENAQIKPGFTYGQLITQAIMENPEEKRTLNEIYKFCKDNYSWFRRPGHEKGWQNSIRHNLSLNPGFEQKARESNEPGKGGYWRFDTDLREKLIADAWGGKRRSPHKGSSSASRSPPTQNGRSAHGPGDINGGSPSRKVKRSPKGSPRIISYPSNGPQFTPDQGKKMSMSHGDMSGDGSPLPRRRRPSIGPYGMSDNMQGSPPVLSAFSAEDGSSLITPAPTRRHIHLAPPSTAQRPSQHMPTSSPAIFWKLADSGLTPGGARFDLSPTKASGLGPALPPSSSPPPVKGDGSPTRNGISVKTEAPEVEDLPDEEPGFDLTKKFMGIGQFHRTNTPVALPSNGARV